MNRVQESIGSEWMVAGIGEETLKMMTYVCQGLGLRLELSTTSRCHQCLPQILGKTYRP